MATILLDDEQHHIRPSDITADGHLWDAFDHYETEVSARYIVRMCQQRGNWQPFTQEDIEAVYQAAGFKGFTFNRLIEPQMKSRSLYDKPIPRGGGWIVKGDGRYFITVEFVNRVLHSTDLALKQGASS